MKIKTKIILSITLILMFIIFTISILFRLNVFDKTKEGNESNIEIINTNIFHDRFIIIDNKVLYHSGASFKDLGKKCFAITKILDNNILEELLDKLEK